MSERMLEETNEKARSTRTTKHKQWTTAAGKQNMECSSEANSRRSMRNDQR